jgi:hypothetical protein
MLLLHALVLKSNHSQVRVNVLISIFNEGKGKCKENIKKSVLFYSSNKQCSLLLSILAKKKKKKTEKKKPKQYF